MKKLLLLLLFLPGCVPWDKVMSNPKDYYWEGAIVMEWDEKFPIKTWRAAIKLNEPFVGMDGYEYVLKPYEMDPEWYILEVNTDEYKLED